MNNPEMSALFDVLFSNVTSNQAPGLNEGEKSVFLTKGQNMLIKEEFNPRTDGVGGGFDGSQQRQYDFSSLIVVENLMNISSNIDPSTKLDKRSLVFRFPLKFFLAVNEILFDSKRQYSVLPLSYDEYQRLMLKPYNFPVKRGAWRILTGVAEDSGHNVYPKAEIIGKFEGTPTYQLRYVKRPNPIILEDLTNYGDDFTIDGKWRETPCELPVEMHQEIVERAVTLAKIAWQGGTVTQAAQAAAQRDNQK